METAGIVGGIGPESTLEYYKQIVGSYREQNPNDDYPRIIINSINLKEMLGLVIANDRAGLVRHLSQAVEAISRAGADFGAFASNTPHVVFDAVQSQCSLPLLSIVVETARKANELGLRRVGLFGTSFTMQGDFYEMELSKSAIALVTPTAEEQTYIHEKYMNELVNGIILDQTKSRLLQIARRMLEQERIEALILGGTELPLILKDDSELGIPYLDTTRIHVKSIVKRLLS